MDTVVLLHGIWMKPIVMQALSMRLRAVGYRSSCFSYPSRSKTPAQNARLFHDYVQTLEGDRLHFVAHSLGGIILMHYFAQGHDSRPGRVVLLGSPIGGSASARQFSDLALTRLALGKSIEQGLLGDVPAWSGERQIGMIAGSRSIGVGKLLGRSAEINDGAVYLSETQMSSMTDHITLPVSHTGMLFSAKVARQVIHFLENGYFSITE
jgi:pimeloyl-ACP methyl ester carboxylesterase